MSEFKKARIEDKEAIDQILRNCPCSSLEYNFTTLFLWQDIYNIEYKIEDDILYMRNGQDKKSYLFPCGTGDLDKAVSNILKEENIRFYSLSEENKAYLEEKAPGRFDFYERRNDGDYVYLRESLATLKGKKLSAKRNHINRFIAENPNWKYETITAQNIEEVKRMHEKWCRLVDDGTKHGLSEESCAVKKALKYYDDLKLSGGLIRANGEVVAFSLGDRLNSKTFLVHIEKAFADITGAYQIINREFVLNNCMDYEFVNREDDTGDESLRKAKLSYRPYEIVKKYEAKEKA
ncbi:MAG: DUF2156 domain-containing protein [Clostridia bacterium]|nr:DUF2156 domain-containing protein [Clostridia bacterium]